LGGSNKKYILKRWLKSKLNMAWDKNSRKETNSPLTLHFPPKTIDFTIETIDF